MESSAEEEQKISQNQNQSEVNELPEFKDKSNAEEIKPSVRMPYVSVLIDRVKSRESNSISNEEEQVEFKEENSQVKQP